MDRLLGSFVEFAGSFIRGKKRHWLLIIYAINVLVIVTATFHRVHYAVERKPLNQLLCFC